jgi:chromosome segregation ATPase
MAANPTLINGFEDVLTFISQQADRIKKLEQENEDNLASLNFYTEQCEELKDERKKLEEENQKHKTTILSLKTSVDDLREARDMRDSKIKNLMDENKKLKIEMGEELEQLKEELEQFKEELFEAHHQYDLLKEKITCLESDSYNEVSQAEYDELKEENEELQGENMSWAMRVCQEETANMLLQNENKKLQEELMTKVKEENKNQ